MFCHLLAGFLAGVNQRRRFFRERFAGPPTLTSCGWTAHFQSPQSARHVVGEKRKTTDFMENSFVIPSGSFMRS